MTTMWKQFRRRVAVCVLVAAVSAVLVLFFYWTVVVPLFTDPVRYLVTVAVLVAGFFACAWAAAELERQ